MVSLAKITDLIKGHPVTVLVGLAIAAIGAAAGLKDDLINIFDFVVGNHERSQYLNTLKHPYNTLLTKAEVSKWSSGKARLALTQIRSYLGEIDYSKKSNIWKRQCLSNKYSFPVLHYKQINTKYIINRSSIDSKNILLLQNHIKDLHSKQLDESAFLQISDYKNRIVERSKVQLLDSFFEKELKLIDKRLLYIIRNDIYARLGWPFKTLKLRKYYNRHNLNADNHKFDPVELYPKNRVSICNSYYLEQIFPNKPAGAFARAVYFHHSGNALFKSIRTTVCNCLNHQSKRVDCFERDKNTALLEYSSHYVDLIIVIERGSQTKSIFVVPNNELVSADHEIDFSDLGAAFSAAYSGIISDLNSTPPGKRSPTCF